MDQVEWRREAVSQQLILTSFTTTSQLERGPKRSIISAVAVVVLVTIAILVPTSVVESSH